MDIDAQIAEWEPTVPQQIRSDVLWRNAAYRLATFASDTTWPDITKIAADPRTSSVADQLFRAIGSIGANYTEGYSRGTDRDRCRVYEMALSEARECRDWAYKTRRVIGEERASELLILFTRIVQLLTVTIVRERSRNSRLGPGKPQNHPRRTTDDAR